MQIKSNLDFKYLKDNFNIQTKNVPDFKIPKIQDDELKPQDFKEYNLLTYPYVIDYDVIDNFNEQ